ncbi:hypothetical protein BHM03_00031000, partial [Ensete ventricosum]
PAADQYVSVRPLTSTWTAHYRVVPLIGDVSALLPPDFDRRWLISGGIGRGRKKKREKKRENLEIRRCSPDPDPSPVGVSVLRGENLR